MTKEVMFTFLGFESFYLGMGLNDSPIGLAGYILEKFSTCADINNRDKSDGGLTESVIFSYK